MRTETSLGISRTTVPLFIRSPLANLSKSQPLNFLGNSLYSVIRDVCASELMKLEGVERVAIERGDKAKYTPFVSDLDFMLIVDSQDGSERELKVLNRVKKKFLGLQRLFLAPGELMIFDAKAFECFRTAITPLPFLDAKLSWYGVKGWRQEILSPKPMTALQRLSHSLHFFSRAFRLAFDWTKSGRYLYRASFNRELSKSFALLGKKPPTNEECPIDLLVQLYSELDTFALEIDSPAKELDDKTFPGTIVCESPSTESLREQFVKLLQSASLEPDIPLSKKTGALFLHHALWKRPLEHLRFHSPDVPKALSKECMLRIQERFPSHLLKLTGQLLSYPKETISHQLRELCYEAMTIETGLVTTDEKKLIEFSGRALPMTQKVYRKIMRNEVPSLEEVLLLREEMKKKLTDATR